MSLRSHTADFLHLGRLPGWSLALLPVLALSPVLPANLLFITGIAAALGTGIGVAGLRRHGGPGVPAVPFGTSD